jgi:hypothetical protein
MAQKISDELKRTVGASKHISEVHFTASGEHFFNVHEHVEKGKKPGAGKKYGRMKLEAVPSHVEGDRQIFKQSSVPMEEFEIVETLSRDEILGEGKKEKEPKAK